MQEEAEVIEGHNPVCCTKEEPVVLTVCAESCRGSKMEGAEQCIDDGHCPQIEGKDSRSVGDCQED